VKRSEINQIMRDAVSFFASHNFLLPPFAYWTLAEWQTKGDEVREILDRELGYHRLRLG
jgi:D-lyxose ketol-isomerase